MFDLRANPGPEPGRVAGIQCERFLSLAHLEACQTLHTAVYSMFQALAIMEQADALYFTFSFFPSCSTATIFMDVAWIP